MIYFDNAATTMHKPKQVLDAVMHAMTHMGNSSRGAHEGTLTASRVIFEAREKLCALFHASDPEHVVFTSNATEALNIAIKGLIKPYDHVITTDLEHNSVLRPLYQLEDADSVSLSFVNADSLGNLYYEQIEDLILPETKAIICTHASNLTGNVVDIKKVGEIAKKHHLLFLVDASQTAGIFPIDMEEMNIDVLCFTGHKSLYGPQGTGGLCVRVGVDIKPFKVGGSGIRTFDRIHPTSYPTRLEAGTLNGHGIAGLAAGIDFLREHGLDRIRQYELELATMFYEGIKDIPMIHFYGDYEAKERTPIVTFNVGDYDSAEISDELAQVYGIATRAGGHCAPRMHEHFKTSMQGAVRFSFSYFNTKEEVANAIKSIHHMIQES